MRSPTSSEDTRLVRIVVPCAQTRLPRPRGHRDAFSSSNERHEHRAFRQACSAGHRASSEARGDVCSLSWSDGRFDVRAEWERRHYTVSLISCSCLQWGVWSSSAHARYTKLYYNTILVVFSHIIPWLWHQTYLLSVRLILVNSFFIGGGPRGDAPGYCVFYRLSSAV